MEGVTIGSLNPRRTYRDTTLFALEQAMRDVWEVLKAHAPCSDWDKDPGLQNTLAEMLLDLADSGVTDPQDYAAGCSRTSTLSGHNSHLTFLDEEVINVAGILTSKDFIYLHSL
jgi:hypothetical protein